MTQNVSRSKDDYVDIYGAPVTVYECRESGELLIPMSQVTKLGFGIYRKSHYRPILVEESAFTREFNMAMLDAAKSYMLNNRFRFDENAILESIERCKKILEGKETATTKPEFLKNRQVKEQPNLDIRITSEVANSDHGSDRASVHSNCSSSPRTPQDTTENTNKPTGSQSFSEVKWESAGKHQRPQKNGFGGPRRNGNHNSNSLSSNGDINPTGYKLRSPQDNKINRVNGIPVSRIYDATKVEALEERIIHEVAVSYIHSRNVIFVRNLTTNSALDTICLQATMEAESQPDINPVVNKIAMAEHEGVWYRCKILSTSPLTVYFVDYGNVEEVNSVKNLPESLTELPYQAIRVTYKDGAYDPQLEDEIKIRPFKRYEDGTYVINVITEASSLPAEASRPISQQSTPPPRQQPNLTSPKQQETEPEEFFKVPDQLESIQNGQTVLIVKEENGKLLLRSKDCVYKLRQITSNLQAIQQHVPIKNPKPGQIVLAPKWDSENIMMRALVKDIKGSVASINYLDFNQSGQIPIGKLFKISEALAREPLTYMESPPISNSANISTSGRVILEEAIKSQRKFFVVLDKGRFDLKRKDDGILISTQLTAAGNNDAISASVVPRSIETQSNRIMLKDMKVAHLELGEESYLIYYFNNINNVTIIPTTGRYTEYMNDIIKESIEDEKPYIPMVGEVCWGYYGDGFYRAHIVSDAGNGRYDGVFIDFGNDVVLDTKHLRKLTNDVKDIPIIGFPCKLVGLPVVEKLTEQLEILLPESAFKVVDVKRYNTAEKKYEIGIPEVNSSLK